MSEIKAVLFDMDGVLVDAADWHYEALNLALKPFGMDIDRDIHLASFDGLSTRQKLRILAKSRGLPEGLHEFINDLKQRHTKDIIATRCCPVFHHRYLLSRLAREGYRLALCSNSVRETVDHITSRARLIEYLEFTLSNEDVNAAKPAPDIYDIAVARMGLNPADCLIVEDNPNGIAAAKASGCHVMEVASPDDVTYANVIAKIRQLSAQGAK